MKNRIVGLLALFVLSVVSLNWQPAKGAGMEFVLIGGGNMFYNTSLRSEIARHYPGALVADCSYIGLSMSDIKKGQPIYNDCVARSKVAGRKIKAILVFQGENDAIVMKTAQAWKTNFNTFVKNFLRDTRSAPNTYVIYAQLGPVPAALNAEIWNTVRTAQASNLKGHPHYRMIKTYDLPMIPDNIFFSEEAYPVIAERYIKTILSIIKK